VAAGPQRLVDARKQLLLLGRLEMVNGEGGDDEVEGPGRQRILQPRNATVDVVEVDAIEHARVLVDRDDRRRRVARAQSVRRPAGAGTEIEAASHLDALRRGGEAIVQLVVRGYLGGDELRVRRRVEMELAQAR
jgi:hypothetical protein